MSRLVALLHGTSTGRLPRIQRDGLVRPYLTDDPEVARYFATVTAEDDGTSPVILRVIVPTSALRVDYPSFAEPLTIYRNVHARSDEAWHELIRSGALPYPRSPTDWAVSLQVVHSVLYDGLVPPKGVRVAS